VPKVAIVTGSSRGIGKSIACELAQNGFNVVIASKNQKDASKVAKELETKFGIKSIGIAADIQNKLQVQKLVRNTIKKFNQVDVLVNNAGVLIVKPLEETTEKDWDYVIDTNLKGAYLCSKEVLPYMIPNKSGCIINISSGAGKSGYGELTAYCASKFGVIGLTESLAEEVNQYKIIVVAICPGAVATDMQKQFMSEKEYERQKHDMISPVKVAKKTLDVINGKHGTGSAIDVN
jgi:NAD(P)-dependent dehydrogenase (short-subunit alcohol dehydrogenase family)